MVWVLQSYFVLYKRYPLLSLENETTAESETRWTANIFKKNIATPKRLKAMRRCKTKHTFFRADPSAEQERNINKQMTEEMKSLSFHVIGFGPGEH